MPSAHQVHVIKAFRPFVRLFTAYNLENFQHPSQAVVFRRLCEAAVIFLFLLALSMTVVSNVLFCFHQTNLIDCANVCSVLVCCAQLEIVYFSILSKNRKMHDSIEHLQRTVNARKCLELESTHDLSLGDASMDRNFAQLWVVCHRDQTISRSVCHL